MNNEPKNRALDDFDKRLKSAQKVQAGKNRPKKAPDSSFGMAYRLAVEMVVAVFVGGAIGWYLDKWFDTKPVMLILFFFLGIAAGMMNVFRVAEIMRKESESRQRDLNED